MRSALRFSMLLASSLLCVACSESKPETDVQPVTAGTHAAVDAAVQATPVDAPRPASRSPDVHGPAHATPRVDPASLPPPEAVMADYLAIDDTSSTAPLSGSGFHKVFEAEKRDVSWAEAVEPRMREYFAKQRRAPAFAIVALGCRSTICEVLAVARDPKAAPIDVDTWQDAVSGITREAWYARAQIRQEHVEFGQTRDGRIAILTYWLRTN